MRLKNIHVGMIRTGDHMQFVDVKLKMNQSPEISFSRRRRVHPFNEKIFLLISLYFLISLTTYMWRTHFS
jgi:hypothetical protein